MRSEVLRQVGLIGCVGCVVWLWFEVRRVRRDLRVLNQFASSVVDRQRGLRHLTVGMEMTLDHMWDEDTREVYGPFDPPDTDDDDGPFDPPDTDDDDGPDYSNYVR